MCFPGQFFALLFGMDEKVAFGFGFGFGFGFDGAAGGAASAGAGLDSVGGLGFAGAFGAAAFAAFFVTFFAPGFFFAIRLPSLKYPKRLLLSAL